MPYRPAHGASAGIRVANLTLTSHLFYFESRLSLTQADCPQPCTRLVQARARDGARSANLVAVTVLSQ